MSPELQDHLFSKYPRLFKNYGYVMSPSSRGIQCGDGWFAIISRLCKSIQGRIDYSRTAKARILLFNRALKAGIEGRHGLLHSYFQFGEKSYKVEPWIVDRVHDEIAEAQFKLPKDAVRQVYFHQIKQKHGSLCINYEGGDSYIEGMIGMAHSVSGDICEKCGRTGKKDLAWGLSVLSRDCGCK